MMSLMKTSAFLLVLSGVAAAQTVTERKGEKSIEWKNLKAGPLAGPADNLVPGTRIKVTLRNGNTLRGTVVHPEFLRELNPKRWRPKAYDFSKVESVLLDIRLEQPQLGGYVTLRRAELRVPIVELDPLDPATREKLEAERKRIEDAREQSFKDYEEWKSSREREDDEARKRAEKEKERESEGDEIEAKKKALDKMKEALQIFDKFPEGSVEDQQAGKAWGSERLKTIQQKTKVLVPLTAEEQEFMTSYDLWSLGRKIREEEKKKKEEKKEEKP